MACMVMFVQRVYPQRHRPFPESSIRLWPLLTRLASGRVSKSRAPVCGLPLKGAMHIVPRHPAEHSRPNVSALQGGWQPWHTVQSIGKGTQPPMRMSRVHDTCDMGRMCNAGMPFQVVKRSPIRARHDLRWSLVASARLLNNQVAQKRLQGRL